MKIVAAKKILKANDQLATDNRALFARQRVLCVNLVGSPGCGKTTLLEGLFARFGQQFAPSVIEGDIAGQVDAERMEKIGVPVVQINTDGMCHLDANMIAAAMQGIAWDEVNMLWIENVGNLVCTAGYDLGEHVRIVALSTAEGDDKLIKYPAIFQRSDALVITKIDLLPYLNFDLAKARADMQRLAPEARVFVVSATTGEGLSEIVQWLGDKYAAVVEATPTAIAD
ncbi:MAG: hydrogenase nickel incorporation protein HypB [Pirellulaceae bacterium]